MPSLHKYIDKEGFYVRHSFQSNGRLYHVVYQVSETAASILTQKSILDRMEIPSGLFRELRDDGHLYTQKSGADGEKIEYEAESNAEKDPFDGLTADARWWVMDMVFYHPKIVIKQLNRDLKEVAFDNIPDNYIKQLTSVARLVDGTEFFSNLRLSHEKMIKNKKSR